MATEKERLLYRNIFCVGKKWQVYNCFAATETLLNVLFYLLFTKSCPEYEMTELCGLQSYVQNFSRRLRIVSLPFL